MKGNPAKPKKRSLAEDIRRNKMLYAMFIPIVAWFVIFKYLPMAGIVVAFKKFNYRDGIFSSPWNGFKNFEYFFASGKAVEVTLNTIMYNVMFLVCYLLFSMITAVLLSEIHNKYFKKVSQTILFLPYFVSWVTLSSFVYKLFDFENGILNNIITALGGAPLNISTQPDVWVWLLPVLYVFKWVGYGSVLYLAAISGLDYSCYEAARVDGANVFQKIRYITVPLLKPTTVTLMLLGVGKIMRGEFDMFYQLVGNNGLLMDKTDIIDTLAFRSLMGNSDFGLASSVSFYQSILCFVIIMVVNGIARKVNPDSALF